MAKAKVKKLLQEIVSYRERAKELYKLADADLEKLIDLVPIGFSMIIGDQIITLVDNFVDRNVVFKPAGVRRFDISLKMIGP